MTNHHTDLVRAAREVLSRHPHLATKLSINEARGTVSEPFSGEVWAYVAPEFTAMTAEELLGWTMWPCKIANRARSENIKREIAAGKPIKQAVAIGYSVQRKTKKKKR